MTKSIISFLFSNLLKTFAISSVLTFIICQVIHPRDSLGFEAKQGQFLEMLELEFWIFALTISSCTIFLNNFKSIRYTPIFCFMSFLFLPIMLSFMVWNSDKQAKGLETFFASTSAFIVIHFYFYYKFLERNKLELDA
jgi:hypothetical protein